MQTTPTAQIKPYLACHEAAALWSRLHQDLQPFGFEQLFVATSSRPSAKHEHSARDSIVRSSYRAEFDCFFLGGAAFAELRFAGTCDTSIERMISSFFEAAYLRPSSSPGTASHLWRMMVATMEMKAPKLSSVLHHRVAIPLYSFSFPKRFSIRCRHL